MNKAYTKISKKELYHQLSAASFTPEEKINGILRYCRLNYSLIHELTTFIEQGIELCNEANFPIQAKALRVYLAFSAWYTNEHQQAITIIEKQYSPLFEHEFYFECALAINIKSLIEWSKGALENAFELILEYLDKFKQKKVHGTATAKLHISLAMIYFDLSELKQSKKHYQNCQKELHACNFLYDYSMDCYSLIGLASILSEEKQFEKAKDLLTKAVKLSQENTMWMTEARAYYELAQCAIQDHKTDSAIQLLNKSLKIRQEHQNIPATTSCLIRLGEIHLEKDTAVAKSYLLAALKNAQQINLIPKLILIYDSLAGLYEKEKAFEKAFECLRLKETSYQKTFDLAQNNQSKFLSFKYKNKIAQEKSVLQQQMIQQLKTANQTITRQKNAIEEKNIAISQKNDEKDILLKEIHHRVKNNLQVITSFLSLQSSGIRDKKTLSLFESSQYRINSMSLIHEMLYQSDNLSTINYNQYLQQLMASLFLSFQNKKNHVTSQIKVQNNLQINLDTAIPLGLIIAEIITNALKYAFVSQAEGLVYIDLHRHIEDNRYLLKIGDNGVGLPDVQQKTKSSSLGMQLIRRLVRQLNGSIRFDSNQKGTHYHIEFCPIKDHSWLV